MRIIGIAVATVGGLLAAKFIMDRIVTGDFAATQALTTFLSALGISVIILGIGLLIYRKSTRQD